MVIHSGDCSAQCRSVPSRTGFVPRTEWAFVSCGSRRGHEGAQWCPVHREQRSECKAKYCETSARKVMDMTTNHASSTEVNTSARLNAANAGGILAAADTSGLGAHVRDGGTQFGLWA